MPKTRKGTHLSTRRLVKSSRFSRGPTRIATREMTRDSTHKQHTSVVPTTGDFTIVYFYKTTGFSGCRPAFDISSTSPNYSFMWGYHCDGGMALRNEQGGETWWGNGTWMNSGNWNRNSIVCSGSTITWNNAGWSGSRSAGPAARDGNLWVGSRESGDGYPGGPDATALVANLESYARVLTSSEINAISAPS